MVRVVKLVDKTTRTMDSGSRTLIVTKDTKPNSSINDANLSFSARYRRMKARRRCSAAAATRLASAPAPPSR